MKGRSIQQAVWSRYATAQWARTRGLALSAMLFDVRKAFDHVRWSHLITMAERFGYPLDVLRLVLRLYSTERPIIVFGFLAYSVRPNRSIVAGCTLADSLMLLLMKAVDALITAPLAPSNVLRSGLASSAFRAVVADDYQVFICSPPQLHSKRVEAAYNCATVAFSALDLPTHDKKLAIVTSDASLLKPPTMRNRAPAATRKRTYDAIHPTVRNLGADFTISRRRLTPVAKGRGARAKQIAIRLARLRPKGSLLAKVAPSLINATASFGDPI